MAFIGCGCSYYGQIVVVQGTQIKVNRNSSSSSSSSRKNNVSMLHNNNHQLPNNKPSTLMITSSSLQNKFFEDHLEGIICYKTKNGEVICEGYDEGPRFNRPQATRNNTYRTERSRECEFQVIDILDQEWFQFVQDNGLLLAEKGVTVVEELDSIISDDNLN
ncbi:hypothetical protein AQUCO_02000591v1 [Aquilegia coerulea]|uniref:Uncharacterized protein n=2 Tax=Aquilegia coerulea TaxID=218851 RepID=A0A2G5DIC1_AQUCA|nr:hypothetical protein AQUCO_02000591v1 [Aquilegia coerulea]